MTHFRLPFATLVVALSLCALTGVSLAQHIPLKTYGREEGLRDLNEDCMIQDRAGYLWAGTEEGLYRYDGKHFRQFSQGSGLTSQVVGPIVQDDSGMLWVGTDSGLFVQRGESFEAIPDSHVQGEISSCSALTSWQDGALLSNNGAFWLIRSLPKDSSKAKSSWVIEPFSKFPSSWGEAGGVLRDQLGELWAGCGDSICHIASEHVERFTEGQGVPHDSWLHFLRTRDGGLWARGKSHVIFLSRGGNRFENRTGALGNLLYRDDGPSFVEDPLGRVLLEYENGIAVWQNAGWHPWGDSNQKVLSRSFPLLTDREGNLWLSEAGHGIFRCLGYGTWESWTEDEGILQGLVYGVIRDRKDRIWVAAHAGLFMSAPPHTRFVQVFPQIHAATQLRALLETRAGGIWAAGRTKDALYLDPQTLQPHVIPISAQDGYISSMLEMEDGSIWMATENGLVSVRRAGTQFRVEHIFVPIFGQKRIIQLAKDADGDIFALVNSAIFHYSRGSWRAIQLPPAATGLNLSSLTMGGKNQLWVAGESSVFRLDIDNDTVAHVKEFSHRQFVSDLVDFIGKENSGAIWVGGNQGVARYDGKSWRFFSTEDGLIWQDTDSRAFFADPDGSVWIGTSDGLSNFRATTDTLHPPELPAPQVEAILGHATLYQGAKQIFPWTNSALNLSIAPLAFLHESAIDFQYRLKGLEAGWSYDSTGTIRYPNLPPGSYTFEISSMDGETHRRSSIRSISFRILPPWWKRWPTVAFSCLLGISLLVLLVRLIVQYLLNRRLLEEQARKDGLTKLWNRSTGLALLRSELSRAQHLKQPLLLVMADIDHFKGINDTYGHLAGDAVIREIASLLHSSLRSCDTVCRYGGEEFLLILPQISRDSAQQRVEALHESIKNLSILFDQKPIRVTGSLGALYIEAPQTDTPEVFLQQADQLLYAAKRGGRDCIRFADYTQEVPDCIRG